MPSRSTRTSPMPVLGMVDGSTSKLAATTASRIVDDVAALGWPVGEVLGSESELLERYDVSRAVFREAVRLVEHQQVARMRRGPGGGLVVTEPTVEAIIDAAVVYLHRVDARLDEVFEARMALEEIVVETAPERLEEEDLVRLRDLLAAEAAGEVTDHRALHAMLASLTRNPALELFVDILNRVSVLYLSDPKLVGSTTVKESRHAHARIAEAVMANDAGLARRRMRKHLDAEAEYLQRRRATRQLLPDTSLGGAVSNRRAERLARTILQEIVSEDLAPGTLLGSEAELMERHGVSRSVLREAVRLLEHHNVATMRRGPGGGFFVAPPDVAAVTNVVGLYLARRGMSIADLADLRTRLELVLIGLAAPRIDDEAAARLRESLEHERNASDEEFADAVHDLHAAIAAIAGNRALELVTLVLIRITRLYQLQELSDDDRQKISDEVSSTHAGIVDALVDGDVDVARHRMRRHLDRVGGRLARNRRR